MLEPAIFEIDCGTGMYLTPRERDKLLVAMAAEVARKRLARGVKLNYAEAVALISDVVTEGARDGRTVAELVDAGARAVAAHQVMDGIADMIPEIEVEATFPDGAKLVTVPRPIRGFASASAVVPGEVIAEEGEIEMNPHRAVTDLDVTNTGDRSIEIGSHYHFAEANAALRFDREAARGKRLDIVPGTTMPFEPGQTRTVRVIDVAGSREVVGFRGEEMGPVGA